MMKIGLPRSRAYWITGCAVFAALAVGGCTSILGFDQEYNTSQSGGSGGTGAATATSTSTGGGTSTGTTASTGGSGGHMQMGCVDVGECPPSPDPCWNAVCSENVCGFLPAEANKLLNAAEQVAGDCRDLVCDGTGSITYLLNPADLPPPQGPCWVGSCDSMVPGQVPAAANKPCSEGTGIKCDGMGKCVECTVAADCATTICLANTCVSAQCNDGVKNGNETDLDCGGSCGASCEKDQGCNVNADCVSGNCTGDKCALGSDGEECTTNAGCVSGICEDNVCCATTCVGECVTCKQAGIEGICVALPAGTQANCPGSVCNSVGVCGVCTPGENLGQCCEPCAKGDSPSEAQNKDSAGALPPSPPDCCYDSICGPDGMPPPCGGL
ncbi:MAG: hypothetical protein IPK82_08760 [Polyangiaceae bacterium]|nr:hypothetical protein [Polyangiaceae bacterium]